MYFQGIYYLLLHAGFPCVYCKYNKSLKRITQHFKDKTTIYLGLKILFAKNEETYEASNLPMKITRYL